MSIVYRTGDLLSDFASALIIPTNCEGIAGAGLALQAKRRFPWWFNEYKLTCDHGSLRPGGIIAHARFGRWVVSFATKDTWRLPSRLAWVENGLRLLHQWAEETSRLPIGASFNGLAVPALGCGRGALAWRDVQPLMERHLGRLQQDVRVYLPRELS